MNENQTDGEDTMRPEEEIRDALDKLEAVNFLSWTGDKFKYGYLMGKLTALDWVLRKARGFDLSCHFDYEGWCRELKEAGDIIQEHFRKPKSEEE
jgi:hypothetical protein